MNRQRKVVITVTYNDLGMIVDTKAEELNLSAQPNLQPICNQLATDSISRQDAIDALKVCDSNYDGVGCKRCPISDDDNDAWYDEKGVCCWEHLMRSAAELLSVQPERRWIPVSERLPDADEDGYSDLVLVSFSNFSVPAILEYRKGDDDWYEQTEADGEPGVSGIGLVVNAWMPLPKPYTEDKT